MVGGVHEKSRPAANRLKKLQALRKQSLQKRFGHETARRLFVERSGGSAAKAAGRKRLAPVPSETDWARLKDDEGKLNDALLDFHLDRLAVLSSVANRVHAFSSLFYTRLMEGGCKQVSTWTRSLRQKDRSGIFSKDVIFVPAHDSVQEHWFLALIIHPWAPVRMVARNGELPAPSNRQTFIAFLDSLDPRLEVLHSAKEPYDLQALQQQAAGAKQRQEKALKLLQEYLKHEWQTCFAGTDTNYCADLIQGISLEVPQQTNMTDCGIYVLEYARCLLDNPRLLEHLCTHQASPPQLIAPVSRSLRQRWQKLGARLVADADPRSKGAMAAIPTPARSSAKPEMASLERVDVDEVFEVHQGIDLPRGLPVDSGSPEENLKILDFYLPRLAMSSNSADRVVAYESIFYRHLLREDWPQALKMSSEIRRDMAEGTFTRDLIMVPFHDNGNLFLALMVQPWAAVEVVSATPDTATLPPSAFVAFVAASKAKADLPVKCLEKFREYLKREYAQCFGLAMDYHEEQIHEVVLKLPQGDKNPTMALLELAHRLLDPGTLDHLCSEQEPSGSLSAPLQLQEMKPADLLLPE